MEGLIVILFIVAAIAGAVIGLVAAQKRREAFFALANRLGLSFVPDKNYSIPDEFGFLDRLDRGSNRYAYNILTGSYQGHQVQVFDYHYKTGSGKNAKHHHFSFFMLRLPAHFPELIIAPEDVFSKVAQAFGYDDIDFESHEFSRRFCVRSADKKFAYDVCHGRMMEYLLANPDLSVEMEGSVMAVAFSHCLDPEQMERNLGRLVALRGLMPEYLFAKT